MNLNLKRSPLVDLRLKIFTEMQADLEAQFLALLELRERVRRTELSATAVVASARDPHCRLIAASMTRRSSSKACIAGPASMPPGVRY